MSKIIKAAELKVLVPNKSQTVIPAPELSRTKTAGPQGTVLEASNLIANAHSAAAQIVKRAQEQAAGLIEKAQTEVETERLSAQKRGFEEGYQEGLLRGKEECQKQAASFLKLLEETVQAAAQKRAQALKTLEEDFLKFSLILADRIVRKSIKEDVSWLGPIVEEGLARLGSVQEVIVRLHPEDYALVQEQRHQLQLQRGDGLSFEMDPNIARGGCLLESPNGAVDGRLEKRLGKLAAHLLEVLYNGES